MVKCHYELQIKPIQKGKIMHEQWGFDKLKVAEWFGGIGAFTYTLKKMNIPHKIVDYIELNKFAVKSFNALNNTNFLPQDIKNVDLNKEIDFLVAGWPCQDYSIAGQGQGLKGDKSSLILITLTKLKLMKIKPKYILLENVKGLYSKKHIDDFNFIKNSFTNLGYHWEQILLNAKYFNIPQNRERVYMLLTRQDIKPVSLMWLNSYQIISKTLEDVIDFQEPCYKVKLPAPINSQLIYFKNKMSIYNNRDIELNLKKLTNQNPHKINKVATLGTIRIFDNKFNNVKFNVANHFTGIKGISKCLRSGDADFQTKILFATSYDHIPFASDKWCYGIKGISPTLISSSSDFKGKILYEDKALIHYRKLSAKECWRLMGFSDWAYYKCKKVGVSNSQLVSQAGNSIVVNVLVAILKTVKGEII